MRNIPYTLSIKSGIHCGKCFKELPPGELIESYERVSVGFTDIGFQVWCVRHNCNVVHIDFCGHTLNGNCTTPIDPDIDIDIEDLH